MEERNFMIINSSEIGLLDFSQILETSPETLRLSVSGEKTFVKWEGSEIPSSVNNLTTKEGPYTYQEIISILETIEWSTGEI
jgi:hypothetical protein